MKIMSQGKRAMRLMGAAALALALSGTASMAKQLKFIYVSPDAIGVNAFLKMGKTGIEAAGKKFGAVVKTFESDSPQSRLENVNAAVNEGADIVVVLGFEFNDILAEIAPTAPDTKFLIVDQCIFKDRPANVSCAVFREYEPSYLMGVIAAMNSKTGKVGAVSALDIPFLHRYTDGFAMGAKSINPDIKVDVRWVGGPNPFADPVRAKEQALALHSEGADVIFSATAGGDFGVFEGAKEAGFKVLSVDVNHCPDAKGVMYDNTLKLVDSVIVQSINGILSGKGAPIVAYGLKEGGMGSLSTSPDDVLAASECLVAKEPKVVAKVRAVAADIISGKLKIQDPMFAK